MKVWIGLSQWFYPISTYVTQMILLSWCWPWHMTHFMPTGLSIYTFYCSISVIYWYTRSLFYQQRQAVQVSCQTLSSCVVSGAVAAPVWHATFYPVVLPSHACFPYVPCTDRHMTSDWMLDSKFLLDSYLFIKILYATHEHMLDMTS